MDVIGNELISVIVPVYNAEKYLVECVESIRKQSYQNIEIILVNDGSKDHSLELCEKLSLEDSRIAVVSKENGGSSSARNAGLNYAIGSYIFFVDADDYIDENAIEELYKVLLKNQADIALGNAKEFGNSSEERITESSCNGVITGWNVLDMPGRKDGWLYIAVWNKLFRKAVFDSVRFPEGLSFEDEYIFHEIFDPKYKIVCIEDAHYHYRINEDSITRKKFNFRKLDIIEGYFHRFLFLKEIEKGKYPKESINLYRQMLHIETAGFQYLQKAFVDLSASERKSEAVAKRIQMDREMVAYLIRKKIISPKSAMKRHLFYRFPRLSSKIAQFIKR